MILLQWKWKGTREGKGYIFGKKAPFGCCRPIVFKERGSSFSTALKKSHLSHYISSSSGTTIDFHHWCFNQSFSKKLQRRIPATRTTNASTFFSCQICPKSFSIYLSMIYYDLRVWSGRCWPADRRCTRSNTHRRRRRTPGGCGWRTCRAWEGLLVVSPFGFASSSLRPLLSALWPPPMTSPLPPPSGET